MRGAGVRVREDGFVGARRIDWDRFPDDPDFIVLADTEGNRFCIGRPRPRVPRLRPP